MNGSELTFAQWQGVYESDMGRIFTLWTVLALAGHAWIGLWTVATDYMKKGGVRIAFLGKRSDFIIRLCCVGHQYSLGILNHGGTSQIIV